MPSIIETIYRSTTHGEPQQPVDTGKLTIGVGLEGDRYAGTGAGVISMIEAEAVEEFNRITGLDIDPGETGRNIVTRGIRLNPLVGRQFSIGDVLLEGIELCEPCATLGARLATAEVGNADVVKAFAKSAGLRAIVCGTGMINRGTAVTEMSSCNGPKVI